MNRITHSRRAERRGSAVVEYSLTLALIAGAILLLAMTLGDQARNVFSGLGGSLASTAGRTSAGERVASAEQTATGNPATQPSSAVGVARSIGLLVLGAAVIGAAVSLSLVRRGRAPVQDKDDLLPPQPAPVEAKPQPLYVAKRQQILRSLAVEGRRVLHNNLAARQMMSQRVTKVLPDATLEDVSELMGKRQLRHVLVCDAAGCLLGVISDRDLAAGKGRTARDIMTADPITINPDTPAGVLVSILLERRFSSLPVVQDRQLIGIVTMSDVAMTLQCTLQLVEQLISELERLTQGGLFVSRDDESAPDQPEECTVSA